MTPTTHIIGAGLAGLAAATALAPRGRVVVHEAARLAGGRCRSYFDATLGQTIDNGNHLLLSGNHAAENYLARIGAADALEGPQDCVFDFADLASGARWRLRPNAGRMPWWIFSGTRRVPDTDWRDYFDGARLLRAKADATIADVMRKRGNAWQKLWAPVFVSALNTAPEEASARLAANVVRESLGAGGRAARPRVAREGLGVAFIDPALAMLARHGCEIRYGARLRAFRFESGRVTGLQFRGTDVSLAPDDRVILAVPPWIAADLVPGLVAPDEFRAILNVHFACPPPPRTPLLTGLVGGISEWVFAFHGRLSVTVSAADRYMDASRETLAAQIWDEVSRVTGATKVLPVWQIVKEKRATFAATPAQDAKRPSAATRWPNLTLAGDWTQTDLPATIEGAIRSGDRAAAQV
jgi:squalene-associated FAD-dependent desaturase